MIFNLNTIENCLEENNYTNIDTRKYIYINKSIKENQRKHEEYFTIAYNLALKSTLNSKHGCIIVYKGKIISSGWNKCTIGKDKIFSIHAEISAISKIKRFRNQNKILENSTLYVVRISNDIFDQTYKLSKPCNSCCNFIDKIGIKKIYHS